ncbi:hypothetical protein BC628DRAFT_1423790 [Trametes gibbosa]|nr:hypothetical protein BC628DRAFT_1423790 [Trametes gibbosa]
MAFVLADPSTLARDKWPQHIAHIAQESSASCDNLGAARLVPYDDEDLSEWLWVDHQPEMSRALVYIRQDVAGVNDGNVEVVVRFQGVIAEMNLNIGGNWDGSAMNAKKATQYLTLTSGGCGEAFEPQLRAAASLRETILLQLGVNVDPITNSSNVLVLRRRVFTKIRVGANDHLPSVVKAAEDPRSKFADIRSQWRVTERVIAATHLAHGAIFPIPPLALRRGDFVDVSARVTVTIMRNARGRYYEVGFEPITIRPEANDK